MPEHQPNQQQRQREPDPTVPWHKGIGGGDPVSPKIEKPDTKSILDKLRRVAPNQAKKYYQWSGE
jgi:hypothetical protein